MYYKIFILNYVGFYENMRILIKLKLGSLDIIERYIRVCILCI